MWKSGFIRSLPCLIFILILIGAVELPGNELPCLFTAVPQSFCQKQQKQQSVQINRQGVFFVVFLKQRNKPEMPLIGLIKYPKCHWGLSAYANVFPGSASNLYYSIIFTQTSINSPTGSWNLSQTTISSGYRSWAQILGSDPNSLINCTSFHIWEPNS